MMVNKTKTERGFDIIQAEDLYGKRFSIQKSSLAFEDAIWFGIDDPDPKILASRVIPDGIGWVKYPIPDDVFINARMHLSKEQVKNILPILQKFVDTGEI